jgi:hypothetical protein
MGKGKRDLWSFGLVVVCDEMIGGKEVVYTRIPILSRVFLQIDK